MSPDALELWPQSGDLFALKPGVHGVAEPLFSAEVTILKVNGKPAQ